MSYDKSVWTDEKPDPRKWYWFDDAPGIDGSAPFLDCRDRMPSKDYVRSVHAIQSAEESAALVELERAMRDINWSEACEHESHIESVYLSVNQLRAVLAALARLDAVRKERGA